MKKILLIILWIFLSLIYLFYQADSEFLAIRLNLWSQLIISGFILAASGAILQIFLANPLADPWLLGVSGASSLGTTIAALLGLTPLLFWRTSLSFIGAVGIIGILFLFAYQKGRLKIEKFILIGIGFNVLSSSLIIFLQNIFQPNDMFTALARISGHFTVRTLEERLLLIPALLLTSGFLIIRHKELSILASGDEEAQVVGVDTQKLKQEGLLICSLSLACIVSIGGSLGFIGLAVPHIIRRFFRQDTLDIGYLIPISGSLIVLAAIIVKIMPSGVFIPIGTAMSLIGAPIFIGILYSNNDF